MQAYFRTNLLWLLAAFCSDLIHVNALRTSVSDFFGEFIKAIAVHWDPLLEEFRLRSIRYRYGQRQP